MVGGVLFVWIALHDALRRCERCAGDDESEREDAGAISRGPEPMGSSKTNAQTGFTGHPWREHRQAGA